MFLTKELKMPRFAGLLVVLCSCARTFAPPDPPPPSAQIAPPSATAAPTKAAAPAPSPATPTRCETGAPTLDTGALFLEERDLPSLRRFRETRPRVEGLEAKGVLTASAVEWVDPHGDEPVWRVIDERWVFADDKAARDFFEDGVRAPQAPLAKLFPSWLTQPAPTPEPPAIGAPSRLAGGTTADMHGVPQTVFAYVFRVDRVVARVRVFRGPRAPDGSLGVDRVAAIARRAVERIDAAIAAARPRE